MYSQKELVIMSEEDNIAIIKDAVSPGQQIVIQHGEPEHVITVKDEIPFGFKIALRDIARAETVYKYGEPIGIASMDIQAGQMVHVHNMEGLRARGDLKKSKTETSREER